MSEVRYVNPQLILSPTARGWLATCPGEADSCTQAEWVSLPAGLKVRVSEKRNGRLYFTILEGPRQGEKGSVREKLDDTNPTLVERFTHQEETNVFVEFTGERDSEGMLSGKLWLGKTVEQAKRGNAIGVVTDPHNPAPSGWHPLNIPDHPHSGGLNYLADSPWATTWFLLGDSEDRYLHCGRISAGCVTVKPASQWSVVYPALIFSRRSRDNKTVSAIHVSL